MTDTARGTLFPQPWLETPNGPARMDTVVGTGWRFVLDGLPSALHAAYDRFPKDRRSLPSAVVLQGISAGFLIGSPLLTCVFTTHGWRMGFATCAALGVT